MDVFAAANADILQNILFRLPATSFASAACVNKSWNKVCERALAIPKLASASSVNYSLHDGVREVLDKVLSEPIRPQFAIASIGLQFSLEAAHLLITQKFGCNVPVVTTTACGIIGRDAITSTMTEVRWHMVPEDDNSIAEEFNRGIVLIVGYLPGLKVEAIPLVRPKMNPRVTLINRFMMEIKNYTASVSGPTAPAGMIVLGDQHADLNPVLAEIDYVMPEETVIVGDASSSFICKSGHSSQAYNTDLYFYDAVALVFAKDKNKPHDIGETRLYSALSTGVMPFGPELRAITVTSRGTECSWITASMNGFHQILDCQRLLSDINEQTSESASDTYIGVIQKRPSSIEHEQRTYLAFYEVLGGDDEYLVVDGVGIHPGDTFLFYHSDTETTHSSCHSAFDKLKILNPASSSRNPYYTDTAGGAHGVGGENGGVFGGLMFSSQYHGESFYDRLPINGNFPGTPLAGLVCSREIGRDSEISSVWQAAKEESPARCSIHVCTTVYLVFLYIPPSSNLYIK